VRTPKPLVLLCALVGAAIFGARSARAHGLVGDRFFPPTLATDDPFAVDELALPEFTYVRNGGGGNGPSNDEYDYGFEFDKEIFPYFALGVSNAYTIQKPYHAHSIKGWNDWEVTAKYEIYHNADHEIVFSVGLIADIGGIGHSAFEDSFTTLSPNVYFGKGFGDLPDNLAGFQPFAVTAQLGQSFPFSAAAANEFDWGFAVEYSIPYLQQHVKDVGIPAPFKNLVPLVEFALATTENRGVRGLTTGTINPGALYITDYYELGVEAVVPVNHETGAHVGVDLQLWIFIDDIFPKTFGHPLFGERE
jgi:hypothetical protein